MKILSGWVKVIITFVLAVVLGFNVWGGQAWAIGEFSNTCTDITVSSGTDMASLGKAILSANCEKMNGSYQQTTLELNPYLENNRQGILSWKEAKKLGQQGLINCYDLTVSDQGVLEGICFNLSSKTSSDVETSINLNEHIANIDGSLKYE
ncbi:CVNH domain-containing protein [Planktothrix mougeotii]|uniref:CVNH domain-containing protein n=1 Tax=Planktothrix mougeotii LEGE 06226 TaxID=1828728 RepID=A0ABR9UF03_9CYAN|nr:CVNH domain-containing protein [Planktothrix mougeotii]MBE9145044.1 CVNH domain-containing protein [Planktothrix mougeotii LEGE 06226]